MNVTINGEKHNLNETLSIIALMEHLGVEPEQVAVERNREIVPKSLHGDVEVTEGDVIEIVEFIGGG